jgi:hypothetical protein
VSYLEATNLPAIQCKAIVRLQIGETRPSCGSMSSNRAIERLVLGQTLPNFSGEWHLVSSVI